MGIRNSGSGSDNLLRAEVDIPGTITELHGTKDGKMVTEEKIPVPAGRGVQLRPGGPHIMVFRLPRDVRVGSEFTLRLFFEQSGEKKVTVYIGR
jgi:copper(I)-binding protein